MTDALFDGADLSKANDVLLVFVNRVLQPQKLYLCQCGAENSTTPPANLKLTD